jgi:hypothetical protein
MISSAILSPDHLYRYELIRVWDESLPRINWVMLNPSTADASKDDATIRRVINFSRAWGAGQIRVYNLFAFRATQPSELKKAPDPIGPDNDYYLSGIPQHSGSRVIFAWGSHGGHFPERVLQIQKRFDCSQVKVMGWTANDQPLHPLRLAKTTTLREWRSER